MAGGVQFSKPRFRFDVFTIEYNAAKVGEVVSIELSQVSQTSLIRGLSRRALSAGVDFQTTTQGDKLFVKRLSKKRGVV